MTDASGATTYSYDAANRSTAIAQPSGTVDFSYDNANRVSVRTLAGVGDSTFTYDNANRVTSVAVPGATASETTSYTYDSANRKLTTTFADGSVETDGYDGTTADKTSVVHETVSSAVIASYAYTYDSNAQKTQATLADGSYYTYGYDSAGQLTSESLSSGGSGTVGALHGYSYTYAYDAAGNRSSKTVGGTTTSYTYDSANKLTAAGTKSYSYDNAGSVTSVYNSTTGITTTLAYDGESRMTAASNNPTTGAFADTFSYNGNDQRYAKSDSTGSFGYTRQDDAIDSPVLSDGAAVYNHGAGDGLVSEIRGSASKFYHSDALGSTGALTNASGGTTDTLVTDAFGNTVTGSGSTPTPFGFVGQGGYQGDSDTGLMLLGHRYYDASIGRFLSRDPVQDGYNWYAYCDGDPVNGTDTSGLFSFWHLSTWFNYWGGRYAPTPTPVATPVQPPLPEPPVQNPPGTGTWKEPNPGQFAPKPPVAGPDGQLPLDGSGDWGTVPDGPGSVLKRVIARTEGSGGGPAAIVTIAVGSGALAQGIGAVKPYQTRISAAVDLDPSEGANDPDNGGKY